MPKTYAYFYIRDFTDDPMTINAALDLVATKTWRQGDDWLPAKQRESNCWQLHSNVASDERSIDEHIKSLLVMLEARKEQIMALQKQGYAMGINCVGDYFDEHPGFHLSANLIARLATLSLGVDFDLNCYCADENHPR